MGVVSIMGWVYLYATNNVKYGVHVQVYVAPGIINWRHLTFVQTILANFTTTSRTAGFEKVVPRERIKVGSRSLT
jgi:hypothetical protein